MTRLPVEPLVASLHWRGGARGTGAASGSPPWELAKTRSADTGYSKTQPGSLLLLDSRQVAQLLGISRTKTFQMMSLRQLPTVHIGRCVRVPQSALVAWVESQVEGKVGAPCADSGV
ncbi:MAG: helix-turn-helix domain-containing protein [Candidatus Dormibacteraceae bacterium]